MLRAGILNLAAASLSFGASSLGSMLSYFRGLPTTWDETLVPAAEVAGHIVIAHRSGEHWYLAAMNGEAPLTLRVPLDFLGDGRWSLRAFADTADSGEHPERISATTVTIAAGAALELKLAPAGGYAAVLSRL